MKLDNQKDENSNFWIAYADLMAGLLFVFILLVGAIVVKYVLTQSDLKLLKGDIESQEQALKLNSIELSKRENAIKEFMQKLESEKNKNLALEEINSIFNEKLEELNLALQNAGDAFDDVDRLNLELNTTLQNKDELIASLQESISKKDKDYGLLLSDLNSTKERIKSLSGIRLKVITTLKEKLGNSIKIDMDSGAISLPSSVLFDTNSFALKDSARFDLRRTLSTYFDILLSDEIRPNIDRITIEGHTDSVGNYLYNLELSQKRAYEVMKFIYSFYKNPELQKYLIASGRSFNDLIYKDGKEDNDASRRIEIKFSISNKAAMKEIEQILEQNNR
ncbi:hypothetical protein (OmpA/MotB domain) [Campylobacter iguaniorum]|uniref:OmpA-like domain-containing protein n=1 Tax=Campylobacter iguaniorum TaxID=1244531 RepID=A0A076F940_9BACT|nr:OmpA family protein [Campylobacter iguaniorum]AII14516.1 hypothetical protein (OmpA/MotB domain) [Campylobacter iguaniorum]